MTSADAATERALTAALLVRSKTTLLSVMFEVEQIKHADPENRAVGFNVKREESASPIVTSLVKETPASISIVPADVPPKIILAALSVASACA